MKSMLAEKARSFFFKSVPSKDPISEILSQSPFPKDEKADENYIKVGESILRKVTDPKVNENLKKLPSEHYKNLCMGLGEELISIEIIEYFLNVEQIQVNKQFIAMTSNEGLNMLSHGELSCKDFSNTYISEEATTSKAILKELLQIKKLEMDFYKQSADDFKNQSLEASQKKSIIRMSNPYLFLSSKQKNLKVSREIDLDSDTLISGLDAKESQIAKKAIAYARRYRKKGYSELENRDRTAKEFEVIESSLNKNRKTESALAQQMVELFEKYNILEDDVNYKKLMNGAYLHYKIELSKSSFLANCDEMCDLILDYLDQSGFTGKAYRGHLQNGKHAFAFIKGKNGTSQIWDAWSNKAYEYTSENISLHMKGWQYGIASNGIAQHQFEDFDSSKHQAQYRSQFSLKNLRYFRHYLEIFTNEYEKNQNELPSAISSKEKNKSTDSDRAKFSA